MSDSQPGKPWRPSYAALKRRLFWVAGVRESVYRRAAPLATRDLKFLPSTHGARAGVVGCAALALDHVLSPVAVDSRLAGQA